VVNISPRNQFEECVTYYDIMQLKSIITKPA